MGADHAQVEELSVKLQEVTKQKLQLAYVDQGYTGESAAEAAPQHGIKLEVVKLSEDSAALCSCHAVCGGTILRVSRSLPSPST